MDFFDQAVTLEADRRLADVQQEVSCLRSAVESRLSTNLTSIAGVLGELVRLAQPPPRDPAPCPHHRPPPPTDKMAARRKRNRELANESRNRRARYVAGLEADVVRLNARVAELELIINKTT